MTRLCSLLIASAAAALVSIPADATTWPASVVGNWNMTANNFELHFNIASQGAGGACRKILGTLVNTNNTGQSNIEGFYCPTTGRISFLREDPTTKRTYQVYTGNLSIPGGASGTGGSTGTCMAGVFAQEIPNVLGEYDFFACAAVTGAGG